MAEIKPIRAWRYNSELSKNIDSLTSPLFDVVSEKQCKALYQKPFNSIHLSVPQPPNAASNAASLLSTWKETGVLIHDEQPGIYVYYQYFTLPDATKEFCRKGFVCNIRIYNWHDKVILRHENTIPKSVNDRIELLEKTELNVSPTHGLYTDPNFELENFMDTAIANPIYETEDYQGVRDVLAFIEDEKQIKIFLKVLKDKTIILADGHHRYEGSLVYKHKQQKANSNHTGNEGYNFHLMYLTNTEADDLKILPTHRLIKNIEGFNEQEIINKLNNDFIIKEVEDPHILNEIISGKQWTYGLLFKNTAYKIMLKKEAFVNMPWPFPDEVKMLDLTVMHYFIIEKILRIPGKIQRQSDNIDFNRSFSECLKKVVNDEVQMAIITNAISIDDVKRISQTGYTMPQKSTYFYPKVICGFLFSSIKENEFNT